MPTDSGAFRYPAEKFANARRSLMLPHPRGEAASIADAFLECSLGLTDIWADQLDDNSRRWVGKLRLLMDTTGVDDPRGLGTYRVKAETLSEQQRFELSDVVDELAHWFDDAAWAR